MYVSNVSFSCWRNIESAHLEFSRGINVLWGMNAQGKSNLLEGIYYFARGKSFRGAHDRELVRFGSPCADAELSFRIDGYENDTKLGAVIPAVGKKRLTKGGAPLSSASEMIGMFRAVLFCPANLSIVTGGPLERRTFLDIALSQLSGDYLEKLRRYTKILAQRNALIKNIRDGAYVSPEEWEVYTRSLSEYGAWISAYRYDYTVMLSEAVSGYFSGMTGGREIPGTEYVSHAMYDGIPRPLSGDMRTPDSSFLYAKFADNREREVAAGSTLWGAHKDDVRLTINGNDAKTYGSQGQQRSTVLSMKLAEAEIANRIGGEYPVILLDDVFSELDESRRAYILDSLDVSGARQIIVTSCEPDVIPGIHSGNVRFMRVSEGRVGEGGATE